MTAVPQHLVYFADPMCSWCWGFAPVIEAIAAEHPDLPMRLVMGGLRPFTREAMDETGKARTRSHWEHVEAASGQPFDFSFFDRQGFVYDSEPAARAVITARRLAPERALLLYKRIQAAFYAGNRDVTQTQVLADLAVETGLDPDAFSAEFDGEGAKRETLEDFAVSRRAGVTGFPTLVAGPRRDGSFVLVSSGYQKPEAILARINVWLGLPSDA